MQKALRRISLYLSLAREQKHRLTHLCATLTSQGSCVPALLLVAGGNGGGPSGHIVTLTLTLLCETPSVPIPSIQRDSREHSTPSSQLKEFLRLGT